MKVIAIIQARTGSTRLPNKANARIGRRRCIEHVIARVQAAKTVDEVWVAVPAYDRKLAKLAIKRGCRAFVDVAGKEADVLGRYFRCAIRAKPDYIVRVTGDCCLIDPTVIDACVKLALGNSEFTHDNPDGPAYFCSNVWPPHERTYPDGLDVEVFTLGALSRAQWDATAPYDREHVTPYMTREAGDRVVRTLRQAADESRHRWVLDTPEDLAWLRSINKRLRFDGVHPTHRELMALLYANPKLRRVT